MKHRETINKSIEEKLNEEEEIVKIQFDGRQFLIKIPTEFTRILKLKKGDKMKLSLTIPEKESTRKSKLQAEVVD